MTLTGIREDDERMRSRWLVIGAAVWTAGYGGSILPSSAGCCWFRPLWPRPRRLADLPGAGNPASQPDSANRRKVVTLAARRVSVPGRLRSAAPRSSGGTTCALSSTNTDCHAGALRDSMPRSASSWSIRANWLHRRGPCARWTRGRAWRHPRARLQRHYAVRERAPFRAPGPSV